MKRLLCRLFGHSWHLLDVGVECMRCRLLRPVTNAAKTPGSATHELRITSQHRVEKLTHEEIARLGRVLRRPPGRTQRVLFSTSAPAGTVELRVPDYPGLLPPEVAMVVDEVLGPFDQAIESRGMEPTEEG